MSDREVIRIEHRRFGALEVPSADVLHMEGMPGFPHVRRLALLEHDRCSHFAWLVSLDDPDLAFVVTEPQQFFPDYDPQPESQHLEALAAEASGDVRVLVIATLSEGRATLNLAAPIMVAPSSGRAIQAILSDERLSFQQPLAPPPSQAGP